MKIRVTLVPICIALLSVVSPHLSAAVIFSDSLNHKICPLRILSVLSGPRTIGSQLSPRT